MSLLSEVHPAPMRGGVQRRHSALRTINGGICSGLTFRLAVLTQLLLLGYQRMVNNLIFKGSLFFFNLLNITKSFLCAAKQSEFAHPPPIGQSV